MQKQHQDILSTCMVAVSVIGYIGFKIANIFPTSYLWTLSIGAIAITAMVASIKFVDRIAPGR